MTPPSNDTCQVRSDPAKTARNRRRNERRATAMAMKQRTPALPRTNAERFFAVMTAVSLAGRRGDGLPTPDVARISMVRNARRFLRKAERMGLVKSTRGRFEETGQAVLAWRYVGPAPGAAQTHGGDPS